MKILYGAGKYGSLALTYYGKDNIYAFCDSCSDISEVEGKPVLSYDYFRKIAGAYDVVVAVADNKAIWEICSRLAKDGISYRLFLDDLEQDRKGMKLSDLFSDIYLSGKWGGKGWYSGSGSRTEEIIKPYIELLIKILRYNNIKKICEIGCGDFYIMHQVLSDDRFKQINYCGIDVVSELIRYNTEKFASDNISFIIGDASDPEFKMPVAKMLIIRQVLQHLDNESVIRILERSKKYPFVLVTEHIYNGSDAVYNLNKVSGPDIRLRRKSGVYIEREPFCAGNVVHLLEVPEGEGIIRTSLMINGSGN